MSTEDRLERLERRVAVIEAVVRKLAAGAGSLDAAAPAAREPDVPEVGVSTVQTTATVSTVRAPEFVPPPPPPPMTPVVIEPPGGMAPAPVEPKRQAPPRPPRVPEPSGEEWLGQRGLLAVGVFALILAAGYLLKLSFDRGWISPAMRCAGGALAGVAVGAIGWRLEPRYRTYGASLIGCGAGIVYLSVWAASSLYQFLPPSTGIAGLALISLSLAAIAFAFDVQPLATTAALGAFMAPILLGRDAGAANLLLVYVACMAVAFGWVAGQKRWRLTGAVAALSYFGLAATVMDRANPNGLILYALVGGAAGLYVGLREHWWEARFLSFSGGWALVAAASRRITPQWPILAAAIALAAPVWWHGFRRRLDLTPGRAHVDGWSLGEWIYFFVTPLLLGWAVREQAPAYFDAHPGTVSLIIAVPYLAAGYLRPLTHFLLIGALALGAAVWEHWPGVPATAAFLGLALVFAGLDHVLRRDDGRWLSLGALLLGLYHLYAVDLMERSPTDAAFFGAWPWALWGTIAVSAVLAAGLWRETATGPRDTVGPRPVLWCLAGLLLLGGVTQELYRYFTVTANAQAPLAAELAVSVWWLVFSAALIVLGFALRIKPLRLAGLGVAGIACLKVLLFDLASLDALYRVGSVFVLGLVFLLLAYLYHRSQKATAGKAGSTEA